MNEKLDACRRYIFFVSMDDQSINRVELHHKIAELWKVERDNLRLANILHNLDEHIGYPIDIGVDTDTIKKYEKKLLNLLNSIKDWSCTKKEETKFKTLEFKQLRGS